MKMSGNGGKDRSASWTVGVNECQVRLLGSTTDGKVALKEILTVFAVVKPNALDIGTVLEAQGTQQGLNTYNLVCDIGCLAEWTIATDVNNCRIQLASFSSCTEIIEMVGWFTIQNLPRC